MVKKHLLLSRAACGSTTASGGLEGPSSEGAGTVSSYERPSGPPEAVVRPQAARESNKYFLTTLVVAALLYGARQPLLSSEPYYGDTNVARQTDL